MFIELIGNFKNNNATVILHNGIYIFKVETTKLNIYLYLSLDYFFFC